MCVRSLSLCVSFASAVLCVWTPSEGFAGLKGRLLPCFASVKGWAAVTAGLSKAWTKVATSALYRDAKPTLETKDFPGEEGVFYRLRATLIFSRSDNHSCKTFRISYMCVFLLPAAVTLALTPPPPPCLLVSLQRYLLSGSLFCGLFP